MYARLAQLVEQLIYTEKVGGSSPSSRTSERSERRADSKAFYALREGRENLEYIYNFVLKIINMKGVLIL